MRAMTHNELIEALGDTKAVADNLGQLESTVSNWKVRGIPWRWRNRLAKIARRKQIPLPEGFFEPIP